MANEDRESWERMDVLVARAFHATSAEEAARIQEELQDDYVALTERMGTAIGAADFDTVQRAVPGDMDSDVTPWLYFAAVVSCTVPDRVHLAQAFAEFSEDDNACRLIFNAVRVGYALALWDMTQSVRAC